MDVRTSILKGVPHSITEPFNESQAVSSLSTLTYRGGAEGVQFDIEFFKPFASAQSIHILNPAAVKRFLNHSRVHCLFVMSFVRLWIIVVVNVHLHCNIHINIFANAEPNIM